MAILTSHPQIKHTLWIFYPKLNDAVTMYKSANIWRRGGGELSLNKYFPHPGTLAQWHRLVRIYSNTLHQLYSFYALQVNFLRVRYIDPWVYPLCPLCPLSLYTLYALYPSIPSSPSMPSIPLCPLSHYTFYALYTLYPSIPSIPSISSIPSIPSIPSTPSIP